MLKDESRFWSNYRINADFIGSGPHIREGSPAQNVDKIKVPVLLVHGTLDTNVGYAESTYLQSRLRAVGGNVDLVTFTGLDHQLDDSAARTQMLDKSDAFIHSAISQ
jgi:dipeptidyl aminopeptidase/acylaminoacyl peptidase